MAHDSNGHIYVDTEAGKGVDLIGDIVAVVGGLVGTKYKPFTNGNVNKWSRHKPIVYNKTSRLTDAEFRGQDAQINAGYVYGVKISGTNQKILPTLHTEITEEYLRPAGGIDYQPHRILDFDGYYHNATPSPQISYDRLAPATLIAYKDLEEGLNVTAAFATGDNGGIDIISEMGSNPGTVYLCAMISKGLLCYVAALQNTNEGGVTPVFYQNAWQRSFHADFRDIASSLPITDGYTFSCFLVTASQAPESMPLDGDWYEIPELGFASRPWDAPEGMNRSLEMRVWDILPPQFFVDSHTETTDNLTVYVAWEAVETERERGYYEVELQYGTGGEHVFRSGSFDPVNPISIPLTVPWTEFGIPRRPTGTIHVTLRTGWTDGVWKTSNEESFTV